MDKLFRALSVVAAITLFVSCSSSKNVTNDAEITTAAYNIVTIESFKPTVEEPSKTWHLTPAMDQNYNRNGC